MPLTFGPVERPGALPPDPRDICAKMMGRTVYRRAFSAQVYDETTVDGILYRSRLTGADCIAIYDRAVPKLIADPPVPMVKLVGLVPSLQSMNVSLMPDP